MSLEDHPFMKPFANTPQQYRPIYPSSSMVQCKEVSQQTKQKLQKIIEDKTRLMERHEMCGNQWIVSGMHHEINLIKKSLASKKEVCTLDIVTPDDVSNLLKNMGDSYDSNDYFDDMFSLNSFPLFQ